MPNQSRVLQALRRLLFAVTPLIVAGCGGAPAPSNAAPGNPAPSTSSVSAATSPAAPSNPASLKLGDLTFNDLGTMDASGKPDLALGVRGFAFTPTFIRGTPGQKLVLKIENATSTPHNFSLADQNISQSPAPAAKVDITLSFPASGVLRFFCSLHAGSGMNGELLAGDAKPQAATGSSNPAPKDPYDYQYEPVSAPNPSANRQSP